MCRQRALRRVLPPLSVEVSTRELSTRQIWLILPVVICLFQGLSHASVRVLRLRLERSVYGSLNGLLSPQRRKAHLPPHRDNPANCGANTCTKILATTQAGRGVTSCLRCGERFAETKTDAV